MILSRDFYGRPALRVARDLIGSRLVRMFLKGIKSAGLITETEAYIGEKDLACHARAGRTPRTAVMYGEPGHAYVYFTYGNHWMLSCRRTRRISGGGTHPGDSPGRRREVIRAAPGARYQWSRKAHPGPGDRQNLNGVDLTEAKSGLWLEEGVTVPAAFVKQGPRIGLNKTPEPWF